jgi:hypothetical protein
MLALDRFLSPILGFEGNIPIPAIPASAQPPSGEVDSDPSTGASASMPRIQASKRKATAIQTPQKKARKAAGKSQGGIKINEPAPTTPAPNPPSSSGKGILILQSKR